MMSTPIGASQAGFMSLRAAWARMRAAMLFYCAGVGHKLVARRGKAGFPMIGKFFSNGWKIALGFSNDWKNLSAVFQ